MASYVWIFLMLPLGQTLFATSPPDNEHSCATCQGIQDPRLCNSLTYCSGECYTERKNGLYYMSCEFGWSCLVSNLGSLFGKRKAAVNQEDGSASCSKCCSIANSGNACNRRLCNLPVLTTTTPRHTIRSTTPTPTQAPSIEATHITFTTRESCATCQGIMDPRLCNTFSYCSEECYTERRNGLYYLSCKSSLACLVSSFGSLLGKRTAVTQEDGNINCSKCCSTAISGPACNRQLCVADLPAPTTTTSRPTPTPTTLQTPTPTPPPTATQPTITAPHITVTMQGTAVSPEPCRDREEDGIRCETLDIFSICSDNSSTFAFVLAHKKCPRYCGLCKSNVQTTTPVPVTMPPEGECVDNEQDGLKCSVLDMFNLCTGTSTLEYVIAHQKCSLHCGFCSPTVTIQ